jgi:hypothetical protein
MGTKIGRFKAGSACFIPSKADKGASRQALRFRRRSLSQTWPPVFIQFDLKIFIVDPLGVDVFDKREKEALIRQRPTNLMEALRPRVIGASRRPLLATLGHDRLELGKVRKFFK